MVYLVTQLVSFLFLAAALGFLTGYLLSRWLSARNSAESIENWRAKVLNANRKVDILRWELKTEAAKAAETEQSHHAALAELASELQQQKAQAESWQEKYADAEERLSLQANASTSEPADAGLHKLAGRIAELEQTLGANDAATYDAAAQADARYRELQRIVEQKNAEIERLRSQPVFVPTATSANGDRDDLKLIFGIGPALEKRLNRMGVYTFSQIANWTPADIQCLEEQLPGFSSRVLRDNWVSGAQEQYAKKYGERPSTS